MKREIKERGTRGNTYKEVGLSKQQRKSIRKRAIEYNEEWEDIFEYIGLGEKRFNELKIKWG